MTVTATSGFHNIARVSKEKFLSLLPPSLRVEAFYEICLRYHVDPLFVLAMFNRESSMGRNGWATKTFSWGNTRLPYFGPVPRGVYNQDTGAFYPWAQFQSIRPAGRFLAAYDNWGEGLESTVARLASVEYPQPCSYAGRTIGEVFVNPCGEKDGPVWAPGGDGNNPDSYLGGMLAYMNANQDLEEAVERPLIILAAGHHQTNDNDDGHILSNADEYRITGQLTGAIADALRATGQYEVQVLTPSNGAGVFPGGLWDVAREGCLRAFDTNRPTALMEVHTQGVGNSGLNGAFLIYPDAAGDVDEDAKAFAAKLLPKITKYSGIRQYGNGLLSEQRTQVGIDGSRLGFFNKSAQCKGHVTRFLVEHGHHSNPGDLAILNSTAGQRGIAKAYTEAFQEFFNVQPAAPSPPADDRTVRAFIRDGRAIIEIDFGGIAMQVESYIVQDAGITVVNSAGERYHASVSPAGFTPWEKQ